MPIDLPGNERELIRRCAAGDPVAWETFVCRHTPALSGAVARTLERYGIRAEAAIVEDLLQETFLSLWKDRGAALRRLADESGPVLPYLAAVAVHRAVDWLRRSRPALSLDAPGGSDRLWKDLPASEPSAPDVPLEREEARVRIDAALAKLPAQERLALRLYYWRAWPVAAVARALRISPDSVWVYLGRARERLKGLLRSAPVL